MKPGDVTDSKVNVVYMGPTWGRHTQVGPMLAPWIRGVTTKSREARNFLGGSTTALKGRLSNFIAICDCINTQSRGSEISWYVTIRRLTTWWIQALEICLAFPSRPSVPFRCCLSRNHYICRLQINPMEIIKDQLPQTQRLIFPGAQPQKCSKS